MKIAKLVAPEGIRLFEEEKRLEPSAGEAVVQVKACGICGTDMHIFAGHRGDVKLPRVMGHELSGRVLKVGPGVENVRTGERVVFDPVMACGSCSVCRRGRRNVCAQVKCFGVQMDGGFQEQIVVPAAQLYSIPEGLDYVEAALVEPYSVAANVLGRAVAEKGERIVIFGSGTIGLCILQAAKGMGCKVLISDILDEKLEWAKKFGADEAVNSNREDLAHKVQTFAPEGADIIIDAVGTSALLEQSLRFAAPLTRIVVISFDERPAQVTPALLTKQELTILGSRMNAGKFPMVLDWMRRGIVDPSSMVECVFPLERIQEAFELAVGDAKLRKIIIRLNGKDEEQ